MAASKAGYEVTASKYRPKIFDELAGQEFVVSTLKNSLQSGKIANAYLFSGPRGCGKTSAARILARSLNCTNNASSDTAGEPCGNCDNCLAISRGASMDVLEIDGATNKGIDDIRQIKDEVLFPPQSGRYKVYIIDEVHMLSIQAFNALLKTIEEPPPYIVFIFATTELHKVPATIKSRCQQFNFRLISIETIQEVLKKVCAENKIQADDDALFWIARESTGSMRDAFTLFDQVVSFCSTGTDVHIRSDLIREKLGIIGLDKLNALAQACAANDTQSAFALADELLSSGIAIEQFVIDLTGYYRSLLLLKNGITRESLLGYRPALFSAAVLDTYDSIRLEHALDILLDCYRNIRYSVSPRFELETAISKLAWLNRWVTQTELRQAVDDARSVLGTAGSSAPVSRVNAAQAGAVSHPAEKQVSANERHSIERSSAAVSNSSGFSSQPSSGSRSLADEFNRMVAAKSGTNLESDDEDVPLWNTPATSSQQKENDVPPQVERVLSFIPGKILNND